MNYLILLINLDIWTRVACLLTFIRIPLTLISVYLIFNNLVLEATLVVFVIIILDILDGRIILLSTKTSSNLLEYRHNLDAVIDRGIIQALLLSALIVGRLGILVYIIFKLREVALICLVFLVYKKKFSVKVSTYSRIATFLMGIIFILSLNNYTDHFLLLILAFVLCSLLGLMNYYSQIPKLKLSS